MNTHREGSAPCGDSELFEFVDMQKISVIKMRQLYQIEVRINTHKFPCPQGLILI